jgi:putative DNA primase/helicase
VENGTLDLRTAQLRAHDPADYLTRVIRVPYDPDAACSQWAAFLATIFDGQQDVIDFMQATLGYALTGTVGEQALFVLHGSGANGKSTLLRAVFDLLDGYAQVIRAESLMVRKGDAIPNDIAALAGARFVIASEAEEGQRFAEALVKALTGQDVVTARFLHCEFFTFVPQFKLFIAVNHRPIIRGTENAIWRRIRLVPFPVTIPADRQDQALGDKLRAERPGLLAWLVAGCLRWQRAGRLVAPDAVRSATEGYREAMDHLGEFLSAHCRLGEDFLRAMSSLRLDVEGPLGRPPKGA